MENMIPKKVYIYVDADDVICECTLQEYKLESYLDLDEKPFHKVTYSSPSYTVSFVINDENWEKEYDDVGFCIFRNYDDAKKEREFVVNKIYNIYLNRLYSNPKFES